jgi:integrase
MSIRKKSDSGIYWLDIRAPSGERIRRTTGTKDKKAAQEYHDKVKSDLWRQSKLGQLPETIFDEAALPFLESAVDQPDYATKVRHISYWREYYSGKPLASITAHSVFDNLPTHFSRQEGGQKYKVSQSTKNRYITTMVSLLNFCVQMGWLDKAPAIKKYKEPSNRVKWLTREQANKMLDALSLDWLRDICRFALATGMRAGEIFGLTWQQVDIVKSMAWLEADQTKAARARVVPLNVDAIKVLRDRLGKSNSYIFTRPSGLRVTEVDRRALNAAFKAAGVSGFRFHDLRHTWASWHVQAGTPLFVLKELGGWNTLEMVKRYAHLAESHLAEHANAVTFWSQQIASQEKTEELRSVSA